MSIQIYFSFIENFSFCEHQITPEFPSNCNIFSPPCYFSFSPKCVHLQLKFPLNSCSFFPCKLPFPPNLLILSPLNYLRFSNLSSHKFSTKTLIFTSIYPRKKEKKKKLFYLVSSEILYLTLQIFFSFSPQKILILPTNYLNIFLKKMPPLTLLPYFSFSIKKKKVDFCPSYLRLPFRKKMPPLFLLTYFHFSPEKMLIFAQKLPEHFPEIMPPLTILTYFSFSLKNKKSSFLPNLAQISLQKNATLVPSNKLVFP